LADEYRHRYSLTGAEGGGSCVALNWHNRGRVLFGEDQLREDRIDRRGVAE